MQVSAHAWSAVCALVWLEVEPATKSIMRSQSSGGRALGEPSDFSESPPGDIVKGFSADRETVFMTSLWSLVADALTGAVLFSNATAARLRLADARKFYET